MFRSFLAFLLINTYYQSLGNPLPPSAPNHLLSKSLFTLANQCENAFLSNQIKSKIDDCTVFVPPYDKKQFQCLIFYDINTQLCSAVASSKLALNDDYLPKINEDQDINTVCLRSKEWVFTNLTEFVNYKEKAEKYFKLPATCGEVCGLEDTVSEVNFFCKYYKWGLEMLKSQISTMANNANNNAVAAPVISEPDVNVKADNPEPVNSNPLNQDANTKILNGQIKQTEPAVAKTTPQKIEEAIDEDVVKIDSTVQATSKATPSLEGVENADKADDSDVNVKLEDPSAAVLDGVVPNNEAQLQSNKTLVANVEKPAVANDIAVPESAKDLPVNGEPKEAVLENPKPKPIGEADADYADSDGNDDDGDGEDPGIEIKADQAENQNNFIRNKLIVPIHDVETSQKEYFPNPIADDFSEDNDHFFPFFMTAVVLMVLLYVLYHNKSKVSKVFFGLILEGRQSGRRRNSRGHAYRRLDTLEQAMSANTAAPPSKIIY